VLTTRVRACIKCREYIIIHPNNPLNQVHIKKFNLIHNAHTLVTLDINEVKKQYKFISLQNRDLNEELNNIQN